MQRRNERLGLFVDPSERLCGHCGWVARLQDLLLWFLRTIIACWRVDVLKASPVVIHDKCGRQQVNLKERPPCGGLSKSKLSAGNRPNRKREGEDGYQSADLARAWPRLPPPSCPNESRPLPPRPAMLRLHPNVVDGKWPQSNVAKISPKCCAPDTVAGATPSFLFFLCGRRKTQGAAVRGTPPTFRIFPVPSVKFPQRPYDRCALHFHKLPTLAWRQRRVG